MFSYINIYIYIYIIYRKIKSHINFFLKLQQFENGCIYTYIGIYFPFLLNLSSDGFHLMVISLSLFCVTILIIPILCILPILFLF